MGFCFPEADGYLVPRRGYMSLLANSLSRWESERTAHETLEGLLQAV